jgi:hypothetical protein
LLDQIPNLNDLVRVESTRRLVQNQHIRFVNHRLGETNALAKKSQRPGEPPPNSVFRPLAGLYDSADPKVAEWHVQLAKSAGIDAFLVDWWDTHNQLDQNVDRGIVAAAQKHGFKFALLDERAQFHEKFEDYQVMLARGLKRLIAGPIPITASFTTSVLVSREKLCSASAMAVLRVLQMSCAAFFGVKVRMSSALDTGRP